MKPHEVVELLRQAHGYFEEAQLLPRQYARLIGLGRVINITGKLPEDAAVNILQEGHCTMPLPALTTLVPAISLNSYAVSFCTTLAFFSGVLHFQHS